MATRVRLKTSEGVSPSARKKAETGYSAPSFSGKGRSSHDVSTSSIELPTPVRSRGGRGSADVQHVLASSSSLGSDLGSRDRHYEAVATHSSVDGDHLNGATPVGRVPATSYQGDGVGDDLWECDTPIETVVARLVFLCRVRTQVQKALLRFNNQLDAMERLRTGQLKGKTGRTVKVTPSADDIAVAVATRGHLDPCVTPLKASLREQEKEITKRRSNSRSTPLCRWRACAFRAPGARLIIGATGDLSNYSNPGKVWKRLGPRTGGVANVSGATTDKDKAMRDGYNARRRS